MVLRPRKTEGGDDTISDALKRQIIFNSRGIPRKGIKGGKAKRKNHHLTKQQKKKGTMWPEMRGQR